MRFLLFLCSFFIGSAASAQENDSLIRALDQEIFRKESYVSDKYANIEELRGELVTSQLKGDFRSEYNHYLKLFDQYKNFKYDSAYYYLEEALKTSRQLKDSTLMAKARVKEGFILLSSGLFKEAIDALERVDIGLLSEEEVYDYYFIKARLYYDLADYTNDSRFSLDYIRQGNELLGKALNFTKKGTINYLSAQGLKNLKEQDWEAAKESFLQLLNDFELAPDSYAVATSSLSHVYAQIGASEKARKYLTLAAISDLRTATKENVALRNLANDLYLAGDIEKANDYVHLALDDATFYNARHRKMAISSILPIIEGAQLYKVEQKNDSLETTVYLLAFLVLIIIIFLFIIFKQLRDKNAARKVLRDYNLKLQEVNKNLAEADAIRQDYITYFIKATSQLLNKISHFQASTVQKIKTKQPEEVLNVVKKYSIKKDRNDLFHQFDEVFLKLFPSFIADFNSLFPSQKRKEPKDNELLTKELRIFALYRLGIQDSQQIAEFMNLSVTTIYSYKARLKSTAIDKENFEGNIMKIQTLLGPDLESTRL